MSGGSWHKIGDCSFSFIRVGAFDKQGAFSFLLLLKWAGWIINCSLPISEWEPCELQVELQSRGKRVKVGIDIRHCKGHSLKEKGEVLCWFYLREVGWNLPLSYNVLELILTSLISFFPTRRRLDDLAQIGLAPACFLFTYWL